MQLLAADASGDEDGPVVVAVHGGLDRGRAFGKVQRRLPEVRFVRYDRPGYASSIHVVPRTTLGESVEDLATIVDGRAVVLLGHSLGGVIALAFARDHLELVRAAVIFEAPMGWTDWWPRDTAGSAALEEAGDPGAVAERFLHRLIGVERWDALPERTKSQRRSEGPALLADLRMIRGLEAPPYEPAELAFPLVVGHGSDSRPHHIEASVRLADEAPDAELHVVDGAAHGAHLSHPDAVAGLVRRALERAGAVEQGTRPGPG